MAVTSAPAGAENYDLASETISACQSETDLAILTDALIQVGWTPKVPANLDDRAIRSYAATYLPNHFGTGDYSDTRIASTWELALKNATGARNLKIVDGSQKKDRWFVRDQTGSVLRVDSYKNGEFEQTSCVLAFKEEDSPITFEKLLEDSDRNPKSLPPVLHLRSQSSEDEELKRSMNGAILNIHRMQSASDPEFDVSSVFTTVTTKRPEKSE
ncbi:hypothetical protein [Ruegeria sp. HKCCC1038]|uniref:hypothetical protein n=1 Tax=Ruegeria sp. HKCCC1038 TaxID=2682982 RepID=UPI001488DD4F|nr:hypothetical protein [Ruegeria sp. HKCCC1038]